MGEHIDLFDKVEQVAVGETLTVSIAEARPYFPAADNYFTAGATVSTYGDRRIAFTIISVDDLDGMVTIQRLI